MKLKINDGRKADIREHLKTMFWSAYMRKNSDNINKELVPSILAKGSQLKEVTM